MTGKILSLLIFLPAATLADLPATLVGDYVEARSNHVYTCACLSSGESVTGGREAILAWEFRDGPLAGVRAAAIVIGDRNLGAGPAPRRTALYIDGADEARRRAVVQILERHHRDVLGSVVAIHAGPIAFLRDQAGAVVEVGGVARVEMRKARLPEDAHQGSQVWYSSFVPMTESVLGTTIDFQYAGGDLDRRWRESDCGITGYFGRFELPAR